MEHEVIGEKTLESGEMWSNEPISVLHFAYRSHFQYFQTEINKIMVKYMNRDPYNSVTSFVRFYEEFKKQDLDLVQFFETAHKPVIQEDSQNCIGKALYLRKKLLKHAGKKFADLGKYLYIATCNTYSSNSVPKRYHEEFPSHTARFITHCCLVFKFTLEKEKRRGFFILDSGYMIDFPVVVMEDGQAPDTGRFQMMSKKGGQFCEFKVFNGNYIYWLIKTVDEKKWTDINIEHRWFFVGKKLQELLQIEKRNRVNTFHALAFGQVGGAVVSLYSVLGTKDHLEISVPGEEPATEMSEEPAFLTYKIPFTYFLPAGGPRVSEWDKALTLFDERLKPFDNIYELLRRFAVLATDAAFVKELERVNNSFRAIIEPSFNS